MRKQKFDVLARATAALSNPHKAAVLIAGGVGSGKSYILDQSGSRLSDRIGLSDSPPQERGTAASTVFIRAVRELRHPRLVALVDEEGGAGPLGSARRDLRASVVAPLLAVDDIDQLDPTLLSLLGRALDRGSVRLIATCTSESVQVVLQHLRPSKPVVVLTLTPWAGEELSAFVAHRMAGSLHQLTTQRLLSFTGGNPLCLTDLLEEGLMSGHLQRRHGVWAWRGSLAVPPLTAAKVGADLRDFTVETRNVLAAVAMVGQLNLRILESAMGVDAVEDADDAGRLDVDLTAFGIPVRLRFPLDGEVILSRSSATRKRRIAQQLITALGDGTDLGTQTTHSAPESAQSRHILTVARLSKMAALPMPGDVRHAAAAAAMDQHDPQFAESLIQSRTGIPGRLDAAEAQLLASALLAQGRFGSAASVLQGAVDDITARDLGENPDLNLLITRVRTLRVMVGERDLPPVSVSPGHLRAAPLSNVASQVSISAWLGQDLRSAALSAEDVLGSEMSTGPDGPLLGELRAAVAAVQSQRGMTDSTSNSPRGGNDPASPPELDATPGVIFVVVQGFSKLFQGRVLDARRDAARLLRFGQSSQWAQPYALGALLAGVCAVAAAQPTAAAGYLGESLACEDAGTSQLTRRYALTMLALAHTQAGHHDEADRLLVEADVEVSAVPPRVVSDFTTLAHAEILFIRGMRRAALDMAVDVVHPDEASAPPLSQLLGWYLCARLAPTEQTCKALTDIAAAMDIDLARHYARYAHAAHHRDAADLTRIAEEYHELGFRWLAAETAALALSNPDRRGSAWVHEARRMLRRLETDAELAIPIGWHESLTRPVPLTSREQQIAELATSGRSSPQIAADLHLSHRTVENHLHNIFRKLDITHRRELSDVLGKGSV